MLQVGSHSNQPEFHGSIVKRAESISRYIESKADFFQVNWQSTFMSRATQDTLFVRGKYNLLDVINVHTLRHITTLDTKKCGVFSSVTNHTLNQAYLGCYDGHFFTVDLNQMRILQNGYKKLKQGIYDMSIIPDGSNVILTV